MRKQIDRMMMLIPVPRTRKVKRVQTNPLLKATDQRIHPFFYPLGAYGLEKPVQKQEPVVLRNAVLWTCGPEGILQQADVYIRDGLIAAIGEELDVPQGTQIIDLKGKHVYAGVD